MELLVYTHIDDPLSQRLYKDLKGISNLCSTFYTQYEGFSDAVKKSLIGQTIIVFSVSSQEDILILQSLKEYVGGTRLILILPNREETLRKKGYSLYPRLIFFPDMQLDILKLVVPRIAGIC
jgi:hypothetical protein